MGEGKFDDQCILGLVAKDSIDIYNQERSHLNFDMRTHNEVNQYTEVFRSIKKDMNIFSS